MIATALAANGTTSAVDERRALLSARDGVPVVVPGLLRRIGFLEPLIDAYLAVLGDLVGVEAAESVRNRGLQHLHEECSPPEVAQLLVALDRGLHALAVPIARAFVAATGEGVDNRYFVCDRTFVRAQVPVALLEAYPELLSAGHLGGHLRPVGIHRDVDVTHPHGTVAMWAAVGPVREGNTIALYSESSDVPHTPELEPGDVVLFASDSLHATVPNRTAETRVAVTVRVAVGRRLRYGPGNHWRPYIDARLVGTPFERFATLQSRCTAAAFRRWRWRRRWQRSERRNSASATPSLKR